MRPIIPRSISCRVRRCLAGAATLALGAALAAPAAAAMFGEQLFTGNFATPAAGISSSDYRLAAGDRLVLKLWGGISLDTTLVLDAQGNAFIPGVGPLALAGVAAGDVQRLVTAKVRTIYRDNVTSYAVLETTRPVRVFVTGYVRRPGMYEGSAGESLLSFIDRAGGIDPLSGSYRDVTLRRGGTIRAAADLYEVLAKGQVTYLQLHDGDVIHVGAQAQTVTVCGEVNSCGTYELQPGRPTSVGELLQLANPKPTASHVAITSVSGGARSTRYLKLEEAGPTTLAGGDSLELRADRPQGTITVRVEGAHAGDHVRTLTAGARLREVLDLLQPTRNAALEAVQVYRKSVAARQKERLAVALQQLQAAVLTARSTTSEEASLRDKEAQMIERFVDKAKGVETKGQVVLSAEGAWRDTLLEDGDLIVIPERTSVVMTHGEVLFPSAITQVPGWRPDQYVERSGGYTAGADQGRLVVIRQNGGIVADADRVELAPGDEVFVLPKVATKSIEVLRGVSQILYQLAVAAKVVLAL